jgi:hypothetical protein
MLEERTLNLINADLDGELSPAEKEELNTILEASPDARAMKAELQKLNNLLEAVPDLPPPPGLAEQILNRLAPAGSRATFSLSRLFGSFQPASAGLAFAAGLLMAVGFYELSPQAVGPVDTAGMVGTMVANDAGERMLLENDVAFKGDGYSGKLSLRDVDGIYVLDLDLESLERTEIAVGLEGTGLAFSGFARSDAQSVAALDTVAISGGTLRVVNQGRQHFTVFLRQNQPGQPLNAKLITVDVVSGKGAR